MFEWLKNKGHSRKTAKTEQITAPQDKPENTRETALTEAELALVTRWLPIEKFEKFSEDMKKFFLEAEHAVTQSEYGLELSYLYIGSDGHAEFAYYDCDMTPPSMYEEVFDLTFNPEESEKLFRALGIGEDVIAHGGTELIVCAFRALMRFVVERRDSLLLSDEFPELLKKYGIRTASDYDELRKLWPGSPFNYERDDAQGDLTLWDQMKRLPAEVGFSDAKESRAYYAGESRKFYLDIRQSERRGVYQTQSAVRSEESRRKKTV